MDENQDALTADKLDELRALVDALRQLADDNENLGNNPEIDAEFGGLRLQFLGSANALRMAADRLVEVERQRDQARDAATALEQEVAEALRIASLPEDPDDYVDDGVLAALRIFRLRAIVRVLSADTEGETQ